MKVKLFISWSGDLSQKIGKELSGWIPKVLQFVEPYFTPDDIGKGKRWSNDISGQLESTDLGIIVLTKENLVKPWIMFEAGALAKKLDAALVCPVLFDDLSDADVRGPLTDFQSTLFNRKDFEKLIRTINSVASDGGLGETTLKSVFEKWWPDLEKSVIDIMANRNVEPTEVGRSERELLEELLQLARAKSRADSIARSKDAKRIPFADRRRVRNFEVAGSAANKRRFWEAVRDGGSGWSVKNANDENDGDAWLSIVGPTMFDLEIAEQDLIKAGRQFDVKVTSC